MNETDVIKLVTKHYDLFEGDFTNLDSIFQYIIDNINPLDFTLNYDGRNKNPVWCCTIITRENKLVKEWGRIVTVNDSSKISSLAKALLKLKDISC